MQCCVQAWYLSVVLKCAGQGRYALAYEAYFRADFRADFVADLWADFAADFADFQRIVADFPADFSAENCVADFGGGFCRR